MVKFRFQDLNIWQLAIEIADQLFDIADELENIIRSYFKTFNQVRDQGGSMRTTAVIVGYFEECPPQSNAEIGSEGRF